MVEFQSNSVSLGRIQKDILVEGFTFSSPSFGPPSFKHEKWGFTVTSKEDKRNPNAPKAFLSVIVTRANADMGIFANSVAVKIDVTNPYYGTASGNGTLKNIQPINIVKSSVNINAINISQIVQYSQQQGHYYQRYNDGDALTIICTITMSTAPPSSVCSLMLIDDMGKMFQDQQCGDVTVVVGKMKYLVYKGIISARSSVLRAAFNTDMKEKQQQAYQIKDMKASVVKEMLYFMYTGEVPKIGAMAKDLLIAAEKYEIVGLKELCEQQIVGDLDVGNVTSSLIMADQNNAAYLRSEAIEFIKKNGKELKSNEDFNDMMPHHPNLLLEIYKSNIS